MRFGEEAYKLPFFVESGFIRKECKVCKEPFWTLNQDQEVCGESPCVPYTFIGKNVTREKLSLRQARQRFLQFFNKRGHELISPYPVVCRWRDDMFLTDASIVDFQPYVTSGIAPPPANPLVVSQPCIRLVDVDKVGATFGRHLTIFEMGGAHAFNYPDKEVYWKDQTVRYHHEFVTGELGIKPEKITYKESVWSGGGNAGPCFECSCDGLEVATLVFMQYATTESGLEEIPIRTVDTGYGIERFAWLSQGTPSAFDVIYGEIYPKVDKILGMPKIDKDLLLRYSPHTASIVPKEGTTLQEERRRVSRSSGIDVETIENVIVPLERFYASLDYTKSIAFIVSEGVVPSNSKVGYLARLLLRKAYRLLMRMGVEDKLLDLIDLQLSYWGRDFTHLKDMRSEVIDIVSTEISKFKDTVERGVHYVEKEVKKMKKEVPLEFLIKVYDERGITPDMVATIAKGYGLATNIPEDFYETIAKKHLRAQPSQQPATWIRSVKHIVADLPKTRKLYYERPFDYEFEAKVVESFDGYLVLDQTLFYPEGGGQIGDTGSIRGEDGEVRVVDTQSVDGVIVHKVEGKNTLKKGEVVKGIVDRERRLSIVRHHTATHIMIGTLRRILGKHAWQAGAKKEPDKARLDFYHHKRLTHEEVRALERVANEVVSKRIPVNISLINRNVAEKMFGFYLYQGGEVPAADIRVVEIPGWDAEACGGIHCETTEDVGLIKIIRTSRIQDGVERIEFSCGPAALHYVQHNDDLLLKVSEKIGSPLSDVERKVSELIEKEKSARKIIKSLYEVVSNHKVSILSPNWLKVDGIWILASLEEIKDQEYLIQLASKLVSRKEPSLAVLLGGKKEEGFSLVVLANDGALSLGIDASYVASKIAKVAGGKGGGKKDIGLGAVVKLLTKEQIIDYTLDVIKGNLNIRSLKY